MLKQAIIKCNKRIEAYTGDTNPQIKELLIKTKAEKEVFEAVLDHLRGNSVALRIYAN